MKKKTKKTLVYVVQESWPDMDPGDGITVFATRRKANILALAVIEQGIEGLPDPDEYYPGLSAALKSKNAREAIRAYDGDCKVFVTAEILR